MQDWTYDHPAHKAESHEWAKGFAQGLWKARYVGKCQYCGLWMAANERRRSFCSSECRQAAYRRRNGAAFTKKEKAEKMISTKSAQVFTLTCSCCKREFKRDGLSAGQTKYCSNACKQKAYRESKKSE